MYLVTMTALVLWPEGTRRYEKPSQSFSPPLVVPHFHSSTRVFFLPLSCNVPFARTMSCNRKIAPSLIRINLLLPWVPPPPGKQNPRCKVDCHFWKHSFIQLQMKKNKFPSDGKRRKGKRGKEKKNVFQKRRRLGNWIRAAAVFEIHMHCPPPQGRDPPKTKMSVKFGNTEPHPLLFVFPLFSFILSHTPALRVARADDGRGRK